MFTRFPATTVALVLGALALTAPASATASASHYPWAKRIHAAEDYADARKGIVSFAVVDEDGRLRGDHPDRAHNSHSVVKVMLLVAYLRRSEVRHRDLTAGERDLLGPMIRRSDNDAADAVYERVGAAGLYALARDAGMRRFRTQSVWGLSQITAGEQARFFFRLERFIPRLHRDYAMELLTQIVDRQRWGIPPVAPDGWRLHFKGGWAPVSTEPGWGVNQVMLLRRPPRRFSLAVLTRHDPGKRYGIRTVRGVAKRLLRGYERFGG